MFRNSLFAAALAAGSLLWAGTYRFDVKTDRPAVDYKTGEPKGGKRRSRFRRSGDRHHQK